MLSLALAEFTTGMVGQPRVTLGKDRTTYFSPDSDMVKRWDVYHSMSELGFLPLPGRYTSKRLSAEGEVIYDVIYSIGDDRFRVTSQSNHAAQLHMNFFGCSFMFGEGLNDNETLPYFLHAIANHIDVKNYEMSGYGVHQALRILERSQDVAGNINFLLTAPWHAERSACVPAFGQGSPKYILGGDDRLVLDGSCPKPEDWNSLGSRILSHSNLYRQINQFIHEQSQDGEIELYLATIKQLDRLSRARGQRFLVGFIMADEDWFSGTFSNQKIIDRLAGMGIDMIDLTLAPDTGRMGREYYIHRLDRHPSAKANESRALLIKHYLTKDSSP